MASFPKNGAPLVRVRARVRAIVSRVRLGEHGGFVLDAVRFVNDEVAPDLWG